MRLRIDPRQQPKRLRAALRAGVVAALAGWTAVYGQTAAPSTPRTSPQPPAKPKLSAQAQLHPETIPGTLENLRVRVEALEREKAVLQRTVRALESQLSQLRAEVITTQKLAAPPVCVDSFRSQRPSAATPVACDPFSCEPSSGLCRDRCSNSTHCAMGYVCDASIAQCIRP